MTTRSRLCWLPVAILRQAGGDPVPLREIDAAARALGLQLQFLQVRGPTGFDSAFRAAIKRRAEALYVSETAMLSFHRARIVDFLAKSRLPAIGQLRQSVEVGFLMSYGPDLSDLYRRAAY